MSATSNARGHKITYLNGSWVYSDSLTTASEERPCHRCNRMPTKEGFDACTGMLAGVSSACCGHGVSDPIRVGITDFNSSGEL